MKTQSNIPEATIDTLARNIYKQAKEYGFSPIDYVKLVNRILDYVPKAASNARNSHVAEKDTVSILHKQDYSKLPVEGNHLRIRQFNRNTDLNALEQWVDDPFGRYFLISPATSSLLSIHELLNNKKHCLGSIIVKQTREFIGLVAYLNRDEMQKKAELRKLIGVPELRGRGFGKESSLLWIEYGKKGLGLNKIYLNTLDTNIRNIKLNEDIGFTVEGILRNEIYFDGQYCDVLRMSMWNE